MPTYEYKCESCDTITEVFQSIMDDALTECNKCNGKIVRLISRNVNIQFKGSGFYVNDVNSSDSTSKKASSSAKTSIETTQKSSS